MKLTITLLGVEGCPTCARLDQNVDKAVAILAAPIKIEKVTDPEKIMEHNAGGLPAVLIDRDVVAVRRVPEVEELVSMMRRRLS